MALFKDIFKLKVLSFELSKILTRPLAWRCRRAMAMVCTSFTGAVVFPRLLQYFNPAILSCWIVPRQATLTRCLNSCNPIPAERKSNVSFCHLIHICLHARVHFELFVQ